jgi:hypothetical protein
MVSYKINGVHMKNGDALAFDRKAEAIYRTKLKPKLEGKYKGRIVAIDVESGDYFVGRTVLEAIEKGREKHPGKLFYAVRIGYPAVHSLRSTWPSREQ